MARIFMTGFEAGSVGVFTSNNGATISNGTVRTGAYSLDLTGSSDSAQQIIDPATELFFRIGIYITGFSYEAAYLQLFDADGAVCLTFTINSTTRALEVRRGSYNGLILASGGNAVLTNVWHCIEVHVKIADSDGIAQIKLDGVQLVDFIGDTKTGSNDKIGVFRLGGAGYYRNAMGYYDDIAINDTSGTKNNSWIGRGGIYGLKPNAAGQYTQFTPSAGDNYAAVDEVPPNDDTDYVESDTVGYKDSYALADLPVATGQVDAVQWLARAKLDAAGAGNFKRLLRHDSTDYNGENLTVDTSYVYHQEILENAPDDTEWTVAKVNALEIGMEIS